MPDFEKCLEAIRETKRQIELTESKQRKYQLHRHLNKLLREYKTAKRYNAETIRTTCETCRHCKTEDGKRICRTIAGGLPATVNPPFDDACKFYEDEKK